jgi:hypothetical protein
MRFLRFTVIALIPLLFIGCANLTSNSTSRVDTPLENKRVAVFPFEDPFYMGKQLHGVGSPFADVFTNKLRSYGISAEFARSGKFSSTKRPDLKEACQYAYENGFEYLVLGTVTEWIDGATQWSGTVDVAALSVEIYSCFPLARPARFERATYGFEVRCSIQLSYGRIRESP